MSVCYASVRRARCVQSQKVGILREDDSPLQQRQGKVLLIAC